jgi:TRAP transporter 4TM/12TM fusion protein
VKLNLKGLPPEQLPDIYTSVFKRGYHGIPLLFLIIMIIAGWSPLKAVFWATILSLLISFFSLRALKNPMAWFKRVLEAFANGSKECVPIAVACAGAGIIVGVIGVTGLGTKIADGLIGFANGNLVFGLVLTMIAAIILGTGMPITAVYIICAATLVQPLISMGATPIAAHMFIFMFSAVAGLTPPVAITSYTAAGIAQTNPNKTAIQAFLYGLPGFIIPYIFIMSPELLMVGVIWKVVLAIITAIFGICCLVAAIEGYLLIRWHPVFRVFIFFASLLLLYPGVATDLIAICIVTMCFLLQTVFSRYLKIN